MTKSEPTSPITPGTKHTKQQNPGATTHTALMRKLAGSAFKRPRSRKMGHIEETAEFNDTQTELNTPAVSAPAEANIPVAS